MTVLNVTFPASGYSITEIPAYINIIDDQINEADEQQFIIYLEIVSAVDSSLIKIVRNLSFCHIIDDDCEYSM